MTRSGEEWEERVEEEVASEQRQPNERRPITRFVGLALTIGGLVVIPSSRTAGFVVMGAGWAILIWWLVTDQATRVAIRGRGRDSQRFYREMALVFGGASVVLFTYGWTVIGLASLLAALASFSWSLRIAYVRWSND